MTINVKSSFLKFLTDNTLSLESIRAAEFHLISDDDNEYEILLREGYSEEELKKFLDELDHEYCKECMYGTVWFRERAWAELGYAGNGEWNICYMPEIPVRLRLRNSNNENNNLKKIYSDAIMFLYEYKPILEDTIKSWDGRSREHVHNEELITLLKTIEFFESKIKDNGKIQEGG